MLPPRNVNVFIIFKVGIKKRNTQKSTSSSFQDLSLSLFTDLERSGLSNLYGSHSIRLFDSHHIYITYQRRGVHINFINKKCGNLKAKKQPLGWPFYVCKKKRNVTCVCVCALGTEMSHLHHSGDPRKK